MKRKITYLILLFSLIWNITSLGYYILSYLKLPRIEVINNIVIDFTMLYTVFFLGIIFIIFRKQKNNYFKLVSAIIISFILLFYIFAILFCIIH